MTRLGIGVAFVAGVLALASPVVAQPTSRCADCHFAQNSVPAQDHLFDWDRSPHARSNVGCDKCHGGNSTLYEPALAHRGILNPRDPKSPVNRANLPATCGGCHVGAFVAFQDSRHYQLLKSGDARGPTCSTCHDAVSGLLLSPAALEKQCARCHGSDEVAPRAQRAHQAREMYESVHVVRNQLKLARAMIKRVDDPQRRADLAAEYDQAQVPLRRAVAAGHKFVYDDLEQSLETAQVRIERLMSHIANRAN